MRGSFLASFVFRRATTVGTPVVVVSISSQFRATHDNVTQKCWFSISLYYHRVDEQSITNKGRRIGHLHGPTDIDIIILIYLPTSTSAVHFSSITFADCSRIQVTDLLNVLAVFYVENTPYHVVFAFIRKWVVSSFVNDESKQLEPHVNFQAIR